MPFELSFSRRTPPYSPAAVSRTAVAVVFRAALSAVIGSIISAVRLRMIGRSFPPIIMTGSMTGIISGPGMAPDSGAAGINGEKYKGGEKESK